MFTIIASWLINEAGRPFEQPQEYDDPNATVSNILSELRAFVSSLQLTNESLPPVFQVIVLSMAEVSGQICIHNIPLVIAGWFGGLSSIKTQSRFRGTCLLCTGPVNRGGFEEEGFCLEKVC